MERIRRREGGSSSSRRWMHRFRYLVCLKLVELCALVLTRVISDGELAMFDLDKSAAAGAVTVGTIEVQLFRCVILRKNLPHRARSIQMDDKTIPKSGSAEKHCVV